MTTFVVDANIAVHWTIRSPWSEKAEALLRADHILVAPDLIIPEVTNALSTISRERPDLGSRVLEGIEFLPRWFNELAPTAPLRTAAMLMSLELRHPAYDCFYLALAKVRDVRLVTTDEKLLTRICTSPSATDLAVHLSDL